MTTVAAPTRRAAAAPRGRVATPTGRGTAAPPRRRAPAPAARTRPRPTKPAARAAPPARIGSVGRVGAILAVATVAALVLAVVFHVVLAQHQLQLDRLNAKIATEQRAYEQNRLRQSMLSSPQRIIQEGERLGLVPPSDPATYLAVPDAPLPSAGADHTATTISEYGKVKQQLGTQQP